MQRDLPGLADGAFDLVVVGAGIYGALAAWEAARRGWRVGLIDRGDFGAATSFNSLKTLHGGLRSLQAFDLPQMRRFIRERRAMAQMAPHLIDVLPFCVPTYRHPTRNALALRAALAVTDAVGADRGAGIPDAGLHLPGGRVVSRDECLHLNPLIDAQGVTGGAIWHDYQMRHAERVTLGAVQSAVAAGAVVANYVAAEGVTMREGRVGALRVRDGIGGVGFDVRTRAVLCAVGPWAGALAAQLTGARPAMSRLALSRAMNLVMPRVTGTHACGGLVDGRYLFVVPWRDVSIVGTSHDPHDGGADVPHGTPAHVEQLIDDARRAFPQAGFTAGAVRLVHRGLLPMLPTTGHGVALVKESAVVDHAANGCRGLLSIVSVRYTTARETARAAVDLAGRVLGRGPAPRDVVPRMAAAGFDTVDALVAEARRLELPQTTPDTRERLARAYGSDWNAVGARVVTDPALAAPLAADCAVLRGEIVHAVRAEAAMTLADAVLRRTGAGATGHPGATAVAAAAAVMGGELGWSASRQAAECAAVDAFYAPR